MKHTENRSTPYLHSGWVIANHILVSFHVAFISSILSIPAELYGTAVLRFVFFSSETIISALFWLITFHTGVAVHEMGHYLRAVKLNALKENLLPAAKKRRAQPLVRRFLWYCSMFFRIPYGAFPGVKREGLTYYPDAPFNLSVAAAGPMTSRTLAFIMLPLAIVLLVVGLSVQFELGIYIGRLFLGIGAVGLLDFLLADPGKYREFRQREALAAGQADKTGGSESTWLSTAKNIKEMMIKTRIQEITLPDGELLRAPWQFRNCGMGGRHTEKEYPESNISFQELMFVPLCAHDYEEAQMITITLQTRLKEIIENEEGARVMGIGLEGGLAPFVSKGSQDRIPEQRTWRMAVQAIKESGYVPGKDIVIAYDHAASELSNAYREEFKQADCVGMYYFWRSEEKVTMSRDQLIELYKQSIDTVPAVSFEDSFAEDDYEGWRLLMQALGGKVFVIGDDLVTTKDTVIEESADRKLINTALIKANQIGTLSETMLAILVALGKGLEIVVSHRSKSPNDDMEAQIALSANALGLKTGGGANTERLFKYGAVTKIMKDMKKTISAQLSDKDDSHVKDTMDDLVITDIIAYEEPTNAGIPTVGVEVYAGVAGSKKYRKILKFTGSTPLGTSAGTGEAIHLVDSIIERSEVVDCHRDLFAEQPDKTFAFRKEVTAEHVRKTNDSELVSLWHRAQRYKGKGCQNAVDNVLTRIAPEFIGKKVSDFSSILAVDQKLLLLEKETAVSRSKLGKNAQENQLVDIMQRKGNLGMNAILSVSLAVSRLIAHVRGKDLWQLLREEMEEAMAKVILDNGGREILAECLSDPTFKKVQSDKNGTWQTLVRNVHFEDLVRCLQKVAQRRATKNATLYQALRKHMPIYGS
ncbi:hypothetical protein AMJ87_02210 [candidate division WOR_3 bacterium SM23_60]|uniref:Enolase n=1 Tax=candidate division WOR_3 bacterium SM23_60 TaxID=1703780 RepID=A0A0S8GJM9_UNCW3|nr:MAG: hypothetical protein AMJ87_02210 [candidate division WOR_3 bacterium SM23_60]